MAASLTAGQWSFVGLCLVATLAFILSVSSVAFCDFADRNVQLTVNATALCRSHSDFSTDGTESTATPSRAACQVLSALNHSVGFFGFYAPMPGSDGYTCFSYSQVLKQLNLDDVIEYSPLFVASRVFAVLASVCGGLAFVGLLLVVCSCFARWKTGGALVLSSLCLLAAVCQGLSFLLLDSNMCTVVYANDYYYYAGMNTTSVSANVTSSAANVSVSVSPPPTTTTSDSPDEWVESVSCGPSIGMRLAISAIILYCVGALLSIRSVPMTITSDPFHRLPVESDDVAGKDEDDNESPLAEKTADFAAAASRREIAGGGPVPELDEAEGEGASSS